MKLISWLMMALLLQKNTTIKTTEIDEIQLGRKYTYDEFMNMVERLGTKCPDIIRIDSIGMSEDGREIPRVSIGRGDLKVIVSGGVHARENTNPIVLLKIIETYCEAYNNNMMISGFDVRELLDQVTIDFVPLVNPDGYVLTIEGVDAINNEEFREFIMSFEDQIPEWKANARGVDINRNFPGVLWGGGNVTANAPLNYPGPYPASEQETIALLDLFDRENFYGYIDVHSRGDGIYYYRGLKDREYNALQNNIAKRLSEVSGYTIMPPNYYPVRDGSFGNTVDYVSETLDKPGFTLETVPGTAGFPLDPQYQISTFEDILAVPLSLAREAIYLNETNYYPYKVYSLDTFIKDFKLLETAKEFASRFEYGFVNTSE